MRRAIGVDSDEVRPLWPVILLCEIVGTRKPTHAVLL